MAGKSARWRCSGVLQVGSNNLLSAGTVEMLKISRLQRLRPGSIYTGVRDEQGTGGEAMPGGLQCHHGPKYPYV
jgi:hypothetical protein